MSERSNLISRLIANIDTRAAYIKAKLGVLVPSQIRSLRLNSDMPRQSDLAKAAGLHQSRISMFETPGAANMTIETLARLAAAFKVGIIVKFVPMSEMLRWENQFSQDAFRVQKLEVDHEFLNPEINSNCAVENQIQNNAEFQRVPVRSASLEHNMSSSLNALGSITAATRGSAGAT